MKNVLIAVALASAGLATTAQAAKPVANTAGKQAAECFAIYKMAADAPANSGADAQASLKNFQGLMTWSMDRYKVGQKQFTGWTDALMTQLGKTSAAARPKLMQGKVTSCNTFAKAQYDDYTKTKGTALPIPAPEPAK